MVLRAILFDLDDTLLDWSGRAQNWVRFNNKHMAYVYEHVYPHIPNSQRNIEAFCEKSSELTMEAWNEARSTLKAPYMGDILLATCVHFGVPHDVLDKEELIDVYQWEPFPGVEPFVDALEVLPVLRQHGLKLGLITNAYQPMRVRQRELNAYGLAKYFEAEHCISAADIGYLKPHPSIFEAALEALQIGPENTIFVGDSREADILGAQAANIRAVLRINEQGTAPLGSLAITPDAKISSLRQLYPLLDEWFPDWRRPNV